MLPSEWITVTVNILVGVAIVAGLRVQMDGALKRLDRLEDQTEAASRERVDMKARLKAAENDILTADTQRQRVIETVDKAREELTRLSERSAIQHDAMKEGQDRMIRQLAVVERQLANVATGNRPAMTSILSGE